MNVKSKEGLIFVLIGVGMVLLIFYKFKMEEVKEKKLELLEIQNTLSLHADKLKHKIKEKKYDISVTKIDDEWIKNNITSPITCKETYYLKDELLLNDCKINGKYYSYYNDIYKKTDNEFQKKYEEMKNYKFEIKKGNLLKQLAMPIKGEVNTCAISGKCEIGTPFYIQVSDTENYKFYVISDDTEKVELILDHNLSNIIEWDESDNTQGPIKLLEEMKSKTSNWNNIIERNYKFQYKEKEYMNDVLRISLPSKNQVTKDEFFTENLEDSIGYWLMNADPKKSFNAYVNTKKGIKSVDITSKKYGLRPVITLYK